MMDDFKVDEKNFADPRFCGHDEQHRACYDDGSVVCVMCYSDALDAERRAHVATREKLENARRYWPDPITGEPYRIADLHRQSVVRGNDCIDLEREVVNLRQERDRARAELAATCDTLAECVESYGKRHIDDCRCPHCRAIRAARVFLAAPQEREDG